MTEGYEYAEQLVFYNIIFAFNTSYPPSARKLVQAFSPQSMLTLQLGRRPHSANVLAHLAAARTAGIRCAMKCLARPPLRQGAKDDAPHAMDKGYCAHLRQEGKAITNAHATKKPLPAGRGGRRMRGRFFTFSCPCRGRARPASPLRPALFYRRRRKCHRDRRSPSCRTCRARVRHAPVRAA